MVFIEYSKCSTCKKAKKFLDDNNIDYKDRPIKEENPTYDELKSWIEKYNIDIKKLFNTSGLIYRNLNLKDKLKDMTDDEKIKILATNGMLVKRPILLTEDNIYIGFKEREWNNLKKISTRY